MRQANAQLLTETCKGVLKALIYFDLFDYPLQVNEIRQFLPNQTESDHEIQESLSFLADENFIYRAGSFYGLRNDPEQKTRRLERNQLAGKFLEKAKSMTRILARFPYIKMVSLSGSLSKNCAYPDSDIDYFIITQSGRVWLTRFFLTLYKKTILLNNPKYFCTNLILSDSHLQFGYQSHYIATEIATVLPLLGKSVYLDFMEANNWTKSYFPNHETRESEIVWNHLPKPWYSRWIERGLDNKLGDWMDSTWQEITRRKWSRDHAHQKFVMENQADYIDIQPHLVKGHGGDQHPRIRKDYAEAIAQFERTHGIQL